MSRRRAKQPICHMETVHKDRGGGEASGDFFAGLTNLPEDVYRSVTTCLVRIAERLGVPRDECEDVAQQAWLQAAKRPEAFHGDHGLQRMCSWLAKVAHKRAQDARRRLKRKPMQSLDAMTSEPMDRDAPERIDAAEWHEWLTVILARLRREEPENYALLCAHRLEGLSIQELADETAWTTNEIRCRIYRGMERLRLWESQIRAHDEGAS